MNFTTYTIENYLVTGRLLNALNRAKQVAQQIKQSVPVLKNGKPFCKVARNGTVIRLN